MSARACARNFILCASVCPHLCFSVFLCLVIVISVFLCACAYVCACLYEHQIGGCVWVVISLLNLMNYGEAAQLLDFRKKVAGLGHPSAHPPSCRIRTLALRYPSFASASLISVRRKQKRGRKML